MGGLQTDPYFYGFLSQGRVIFLTVSYSFSDCSLRLPSDAH